MPSPYQIVVDSRKIKDKFADEQFFYVDEEGARQASVVHGPAPTEALIDRIPSVLLVKNGPFSDIRMEAQWGAGAAITDPQVMLVHGVLADDSIRVLIFNVVIDLLEGQSTLIVGLEAVPSETAVTLAQSLYVAAYVALREPEPALRIVE